MNRTLNLLRSDSQHGLGSMQPLSVRLDQALIDRLDRVVELGRSRGHPVNRSEIIRDAVDAYLIPIEAEFADEISPP